MVRMGNGGTQITHLLDGLRYERSTGEFYYSRDGARTKAGELAGYLRKDGRRMISRGQFGQHFRSRLVWYAETGSLPAKGMEIDHINQDSTDDRFSNLRMVTRKANSENMRRASKNNKQGLLGVFKYYRGYRAAIGVDGKFKHIGVYDCPAAAHFAYIVAKRQFHQGCTL
jgi:HNH endonuclease